MTLSMRLRNSGRKDLLQLTQKLGPHVPIGLGFLDLLAKAEADLRLPADHFGADVRGHDHDGVAEVDLVAPGVGEVAILHDLQEHVERLGMRLLDLVEADDAVWAGGGCASVSWPASS